MGGGGTQLDGPAAAMATVQVAAGLGGAATTAAAPWLTFLHPLVLLTGKVGAQVGRKRL